MDYIFTQLNSGASIRNPKVKVVNISYNGGIANVDIELSVANAPQGQAPNFGVTLVGFTYDGDQPVTADVDIWVASELIKYEV